MLSHRALSNLQNLMMHGFKNGPHLETEIRCQFCAKDCKVLPEVCHDYQWDYEMKADILNDDWEVSPDAYNGRTFGN